MNSLPGITASSADPIDRAEPVGADDLRTVRLTDGGICGVNVSDRLREDILQRVVLRGEAARWDKLPLKVEWLKLIDRAA